MGDARRKRLIFGLIALVLRVEGDGDGLPLHRQEERFAREGLVLDRGTMSR